MENPRCLPSGPATPYSQRGNRGSESPGGTASTGTLIGPWEAPGQGAGGSQREVGAWVGPDPGAEPSGNNGPLRWWWWPGWGPCELGPQGEPAGRLEVFSLLQLQLVLYATLFPMGERPLKQGTELVSARPEVSVCPGYCVPTPGHTQCPGSPAPCK